MTAFLLAAALSLASPQDKADSPKPSPPAKPTLDQLIALALKTHPDIKLAEAKRAVADAELEKERLSISQKVSASYARVEVLKSKLVDAQLVKNNAEKLFADRVISAEERDREGSVWTTAKAELAAAELELQLLVGKGGGSEPKAELKDTQFGVSPFNPGQKMPTGAVIDKLELVVRRQVVLDLKEVTFADALASIVGSQDEIIIRGGKVAGNRISVVQKTPLSFEAAVQLLLDEHNRANIGKELEVYVREYGLLIEHPRGIVPKDAIPLSDFIRAVKDKKK